MLLATMGALMASAALLQDTTVVKAGAPAWGASVPVMRELRIGDANGKENYSFARIGGIAVAPDGSIYVLELSPVSIRVYDAAGKFVKTLGRSGQGPGELASPQAISIAANRLYVRDPRNSRIAIFPLDGSTPSQWSFTTTFATFQRMTPHPDGGVSTPIMLRSGSLSDMAFLRFSAHGNRQDTVRPPKIAFEQQMITSSTSGGSARYSVPFAPALMWTYAPDGRVIGGVNDRYSILIAREGRITRLERNVEPMKISSQHRQDMVDAMVSNIRAGNPGFKWDGAGMPDAMPAWLGTDVDAEGRLWVRVAAPARQLPPEKAGDPPLYILESWFDVYSPDLRYLGNVRVPSSGHFTFGDARGNQLWGVEQDAEGIAYVVRYRLR